MSQTAPFPFLRLPVEIRLMVYECIAIDVHSHSITTIKSSHGSTSWLSYTLFGKTTEATVLRVSRLVYTEAYAVMQTKLNEIKNTPLRLLANFDDGMGRSPSNTTKCGKYPHLSLFHALYLMRARAHMPLMDWIRDLPCQTTHWNRRGEGRYPLEIGILATEIPRWEDFNLLRLKLGGMKNSGLRLVIRTIDTPWTIPRSLINQLDYDTIAEGPVPALQGDHIGKAEFDMEWKTGAYYCTSIR